MTDVEKAEATFSDFVAFLDRLYAAVLEPEDWSNLLEDLADRFLVAEVRIAVGQDNVRTPSLDLRWPQNSAPIIAGTGTAARYPGLTLSSSFQESRGRRVEMFLRRDSEGRDFQPVEVASFKQLMPHLARAALLTDALLSIHRRSAHVEILLDSLTSAVLIVDDRLNVLHLNQAAKVLLASQSGFSAHNGQLFVQNRDRNLSFHATVHLAIDQNRQKAAVFDEDSASKLPLMATVVPLPRRLSRMQPNTQQAGTAAIILGSAFEGRESALDLAAHIYELTPSEREVLSLLGGGHDPAAIAERLDIAVSTVRTHLHRLYDKTGTNRQPDLIRLLHRFIPP